MKIIVNKADFSNCYIKKGYDSFDTTNKEVSLSSVIERTRVYGWYFGRNIKVKSFEIPLQPLSNADVTIKVLVLDKDSKVIKYVSNEISVKSTDTSIVFKKTLDVKANEVFGFIVTAGQSTVNNIHFTAIKDNVKAVQNIAYIDSNIVINGTLNTTTGKINLENYSLCGKVTYSENEL